jgi:hypothetical protein
MAAASPRSRRTYDGGGPDASRARPRARDGLFARTRDGDEAQPGERFALPARLISAICRAMEAAGIESANDSDRCATATRPVASSETGWRDNPHAAIRRDGRQEWNEHMGADGYS